MKRYIILMVVSCICLTTEAWNCPVVSERDLNSKSRLFEGLQNFSVDFLHETLKHNADKNVFFSPMSVYRALLLAYIGSDGITENTLKNRLYLDWSHNKNELISEYVHDKAQQLKNAKLETDLTFDTADKFFFDKEFQIRGCMKDLFVDEIELLDMKTNPDGATKHINAWIEQKTRQNIKDLLPPGFIDSTVEFTIANAAYFKGVWLSRFRKADTISKPFFKTPDTQVKVDMMKKLQDFDYYSSAELDAHVVQLPYKSSNSQGMDVSFVIILPKEKKIKGVEEMMKKMTFESLRKALVDADETEVDLELPKFTFEETTDLKQILEGMGFSEAFSNRADFSGFAESSKLKLSKAIHKAKIQVDEEGTVAAAATAVGIVSYSEFSEPKPATVHADHPFLFMVYDRKANAILFAGVYRGP